MKNIEDILMKRGYPDKQAFSVANDLQEIDTTLQEALQRWLDQEEETDFLIAGFKLSELMCKFDMTYPAAPLTMDWLIKEPELATKSINRGIK